MSSSTPAACWAGFRNLWRCQDGGVPARAKSGTSRKIGREKQPFVHVKDSADRREATVVVATTPTTTRSPQKEADGAPLPPLWKAATDKSTGNVYYFHTQTRQTQWARPKIVEGESAVASTEKAETPQEPHQPESEDKGTPAVRFREPSLESDEDAFADVGDDSDDVGRGTRSTRRKVFDFERLKAAAPNLQKQFRERLDRAQESGLRTLATQRARVLGLGRKLRAAAQGHPMLPTNALMRLDGTGVRLGLGNDATSSCGSSLHSGDVSCSSTASTAAGSSAGGHSVSERSAAAARSGSRTPPSVTNKQHSGKDEFMIDHIVDGVLVKQPEDGSCLFHSIAHGLADGTTADDLRLQIATCIGERPSLQIANTTIKEWVRLTAGTNPSAYSHELANRATWGGALEMAVAAQLKGVVIDVYERYENRFRRTTSFSNHSAPRRASRTVNVVYRIKPCRHYDALEMTTGTPRAKQ